MSKKETLAFTCPCEKEHGFQEVLLVSGPGRTRLQLHCPHGACPGKNPLLSFDIPWVLSRDEEVFRSGGDEGLVVER